MEKASLLLGQARGAYQREQYQIALAYFRRACQVDPHSPEALLGIGEVASYLNLRGEAVDAFLTLADVYTQAGMLEVAADVIERILELDPRQPIARRFQAFIRGRLRRPTGETAEHDLDAQSAVTTLDRPNPRPRTPPPRLASQVSESELPRWDEESAHGTAADTKASTAVVDRDLDAVLGELGVAKPPRRGSFAFADTLVGHGVEATEKAEEDDPETITETGMPTDVEPIRPILDTGSEPTLADPLVVERMLEPVSIDSAGEAAMAAASSHPAASSDEAFSDVSTRLAPDGLMQQLAQAENDPFSAETRVGAVPDFSRPAEPAVPLETAAGSGQHEVDAWEVDTVAAINAENVRQKPQIRLNRIDWNETDFPKFDETAAPDTAMITRTIALEGEGAAMAIANLMSVSPLLAPLDPQGCQELLSSSEVTQYFTGQTIVTQGEAGSSLFLLITGKAAVERTTATAARRVASISAGAFFGEGSLLADAPRTATVRIVEDALVLEVDREVIQQLVARRPRLLTVLTRFLRARLLSSLMMDSPLFESLPPAERADLAPRIHLHKLVPGQTVAERGQVLTGFCTVMAGELRVFGVAEGTGRQTLGTLGPGSSFGSRALRDEPSPMSLAADTGCWLLRLPTEDLRQLVERHPELSDALADVDASGHVD